MLSIGLKIAPIFLLILMGYTFRRINFPGQGFWRPAENLAYYVLLPSLIIANLAKADLTSLPVKDIGVTIVAIACTLTLFVIMLRPLFRMSGPSFTSVLQGAIRINAYIAFAIANLLYGSEGIVLCALFVAIMMPVVNVICIAALALSIKTGPTDWLSIPKQIIQNPIIIACAIGWMINGYSISLPYVVIELLSILARAALPLALLTVGAGLVIALSGARYLGLITACTLKLIAMPLAAAIIMGFTGLTGVTSATVMLFAACPASPASYILARQLGGDAPLMAAILTAETLLSILAIPVVIHWAT
jgi:malonate transporter